MKLAGFLLGLLGLGLFILGLSMGALYFGFLNVTGTTLERLSGEAAAGIAAGFFILIAIIFFLAASLRRPSGKSEVRSIVQFNELGEVRVAFAAIENMVLRISRQVKGIRETETRILYTDQGLDIFLKLKVLPDMQIPALVDELQGRVKDYVEDITGASVAEVKVLVENIIVDQVSARR